MNQPYTESKTLLDRCLSDNDVAGLRRILESCSYLQSWWVIDGFHKAALHNHWECIDVLIASPHVGQNSMWDIIDAMETALYGAVERGQPQSVAALLRLVDQHDDLRVVAKEAVRRCVDYQYPNAVECAELLLPYTDMEQKQALLRSCANTCHVGLVALLVQQVPLELANGFDRLVDAHDLFPYLTTAAGSSSRFFRTNVVSAKHEKFKREQSDVLDILLRGVSSEILAYRLSLEPKREQWEVDGEDNVLLYEWIDRQRLRAALEQATQHDTSARRKRKV